MNILHSIQASAVDSNTEVTDLLRRFKILSVKLKHTPLQQWIDCELNGYVSGVDLPSYRAIKTGCFGDFWGMGMKGTAMPIPFSALPESYQDSYREVKLRESIAYFVDFIKSGQTEFMAGLPVEILPLLTNRVYQGMSCLRAWCHVPRAKIAAIVDSVKTRILNFTLEIEQADPNFEDSDPKSWLLAGEKANYFYSTIILGDVYSSSTITTNGGSVIGGNVNSGGDFTGRDKS